MLQLMFFFVSQYSQSNEPHAFNICYRVPPRRQEYCISLSAGRFLKHIAFNNEISTSILSLFRPPNDAYATDAYQAHTLERAAPFVTSKNTRGAFSRIPAIITHTVVVMGIVGVPHHLCRLKHQCLLGTHQCVKHSGNERTGI